MNLDLKKEFEQLEIKGEYLITKGKHVMNFKTDAYTELEIRTKFDDEETKKANEIEIVTGKKGKNEKSSKKKKNKEKSKKDGKDKENKEKKSRKDSKKETKKGSKKTTTKSGGKKKESDWDRIVNKYGVGGNK